MYVSIFADPITLICTDPVQHEKYPLSHERDNECPLHVRGTRMPSKHELWYKYITMYIESDDIDNKRYLDLALKHVTMDCPPDAPVARKTSQRRKLRVKSTPAGLDISLSKK